MTKKKKRKRIEELERIVSGIELNKIIKKEQPIRREPIRREQPQPIEEEPQPIEEEQPILDNPRKKRKKEKTSGLTLLNHPDYKDFKFNDTVEKLLILNDPKRKVKKEKTRGLILFNPELRWHIPDDTV